MKVVCYLCLLIFLSFMVFACSKGEEINSDIPEEPSGPELPDEEALAFPGAEGFGRAVTGGRGGRVIKVTNLDDNGPGSLRAAVEATGARIVVFEVAGNIKLSSNLVIRNSDLTIAGQSAPGDGICVQNYPVIVNSDNIIIRFMRFRMGDLANVEGDALGGYERKDIIVDHCSMSWSTDECVSFYNNDNFTLQWCIISESLRLSAHDKGAHGYAAIWGGKHASFHHNLIAHHDSRNPRFGEREGSAYALTDLVDYRNNVIYNWGSNSAYGAEAMNINIVNNYYKPGPATRSSVRDRLFAADKYAGNASSPIYDTWGRFYIAGNVVEGSSEPSNDNWSYGVFNQFHSRYVPVSEADKQGMRLANALPIEDNVETHAANVAYDLVLEWSGARLHRDAVDNRIVAEVMNGTFTYEGSSGDERSKSGIIDSQEDVGGWPLLQAGTVPQDSDGDGIPDEWEQANGLNPNSNDAAGHQLSKVYSNVEVYLNSLVADIMARK